MYPRNPAVLTVTRGMFSVQRIFARFSKLLSGSPQHTTREKEEKKSRFISRT